jgi:cell division protein ZapA
MSSKVTISINGREFIMGCEPGEEAYLSELAAHLDGHLKDLASKLGQIGELRLLVMASLIVADEMRAAQRETARLKDELLDAKGATSQAEARRRADRAKAADVIARAAHRLEALAEAPADDGEDA